MRELRIAEGDSLSINVPILDDATGERVIVDLIEAVIAAEGGGAATFAPTVTPAEGADFAVLRAAAGALDGHPRWSVFVRTTLDGEVATQAIALVRVAASPFDAPSVIAAAWLLAGGVWSDGGVWKDAASWPAEAA